MFMVVQFNMFKPFVLHLAVHGYLLKTKFVENKICRKQNLLKTTICWKQNLLKTKFVEYIICSKQNLFKTKFV